MALCQMLFYMGPPFCLSLSLVWYSDDLMVDQEHYSGGWRLYQILGS